MKLPRSLFLGHGAPTLALSPHPANAFLRELGQRMARPQAVIVISPHREAARFEVGHASRFEAWHDFSGFDPALHALRYSPAGAPGLGARVLEQLRAAGLPAGASDDARIDHGLWVPLSLMWPDADVAVVPVAQLGRDPAAHLALGRALQPLAQDGVLVLGSGSITHNLRDLDRDDEMAGTAAWAGAFDDWIAARIAAGDVNALLDYRRQAPHAAHAHPSEDHLMPLFVALGAGSTGVPLYRGFSHGSLSLSAYAFQ